MELVGAWIDRFRHVEDVQVPLGGMTLLFGKATSGCAFWGRTPLR